MHVNLIVEHFGIHHKQHKDVQKQVVWFPPLSILHLHLFRHNYYKFEEHAQFTLVSKSKILEITCIEQAQKRYLYLEWLRTS